MSGWRDRARKWGAAVALVAMIAGAVGVTVMIIVTSTQPVPQPTPVAAPPPPPPEPAMPTPEEFALDVRVSGQECDATGCVYRYTVDPKYLGLHPLPEEGFTVEYRVTGGTEPQDGHFTVRGSQARILQDVPVAGPPNATLTATVVGVRAIAPADVPPPESGAPSAPEPAPAATPAPTGPTG